MFEVNFNLNEFRGLKLPNELEPEQNSVDIFLHTSNDRMILNIDLRGQIYEYDKNLFVYDEDVKIHSGLIIPRNNISITTGGPVGYTLVLQINDRVRFLSYITQYQYDFLFKDFNVNDAIIYHYDDFKALYKIDGKVFVDLFVSEERWELIDVKERYRVNITFDGQIERTAL